jgi:hypothetical protein
MSIVDDLFNNAEQVRGMKIVRNEDIESFITDIRFFVTNAIDDLENDEKESALKTLRELKEELR